MSIPQVPFKVKTKVSWAPEQEGDLGFLENEIIEVHRIVDESWWSGKLRRNHIEGIFPKDYVEVLETNLSHSGSNLSLNNNITSQQTSPMKQATPVKDTNYGYSNKNTTPNSHYKASPKKINPDTSYDYEVDVASYSFDTSYDDYRMNKSATGIQPNKKGRLANKLVSSTNHPKYKHAYQQQEEREREIENFKQLQQQQNYHVKKTFQSPTQQDNYRNSVGPDMSYAKKSSKTFKSRTQSQVYPEMPPHKSQSYNEIPRVDTSGLNHAAYGNHTVESFSPEHSPSSKYRSNPRARDESYEESDEIARKRAQIELAVQQLKELETQKKRNSQRSPKGYDGSIDSSYVSEDVLSKRNYRHSRDDLGKKLKNDDDFDDYEVSRQAHQQHAAMSPVQNHHYEDGYESPPPPPPPKHNTPLKSYNYSQDDQFDTQRNKKAPFDADDFKFSGASRTAKVPLSDEEIYKLSEVQQEELKDSMRSLQSDVLNLSELSATSAGSFVRHKYERERQQQELKMAALSINENHDDTDLQLQNPTSQEKKTREPNIFQKMLKMKGDTPSNMLEKKLQQQQEVDWATLKMEVNRMNSLTSQDKQARTRRIVREEGCLIVKPLDYISDINTNEVIGEISREYEDGGEYDDEDESHIIIDQVTLKKIDNFMSRYDTTSDLNELISDVSVKFNHSKINQTRCILVHLCKFQIIEEQSKISQTKPKLNEVLSRGELTIYQINYLFKKILDALRIPSEVVLGFWKKPNEFYHNEQYVINHCWLSVLIDKKFLIMDTYCFKTGSVCNIRTNPFGFNEYYFLTRPLKVVSTHIPSVIDLQHVLPPVDQNVAFYLPRAYSGFYKSSLRFRNFNNALTRLKDLEFFELELEVPVDVELFTLVKTSKITTNELSLCQIRWLNNKRIAKIKAILPENEPIGVLQIFAGPKGLQKHFDNIHELAIVIPLYHSGTYKPTKFVPRFPTVQSQSNDLYVKSPQTSRIIAKNAYNFEVLQHPSMGLNSGSGLMNEDFKIVIESPSGKYFKLAVVDPSKPFGSYESNIKCQEVGLYRGLVIGDSGNSWYVFTQWECVAGSI